MATQAQNLIALQLLRDEMQATLVAGANLSGPALCALLVRVLDITGEEIKRGGTIRSGAGVPSMALGADNDVYTDTATGYEYLKVGGTWLFQLNKKGAPGRTPVKGTDYVDGQDGLDGNVIVDKGYAPTTTDNVGYQEGDQWFHTKSASSYDRYAHLNGQWRLVFSSGTATVVTPTPNLLMATLTTSTASVSTGTAVTYTAGASGGTGPYTYATQATNTATGATVSIGSAASGSWTPQTAGNYELTTTVTDSAGAVKISPVRQVSVTAAVLPQPAATMWSFNAQTRILSQAGPAGYESAQLEFKQGSGAYQDYAAGILIDGLAHNQGEWQGRVKASSTNQAGQVGSSPQIAAVATGGGTDQLITLSNSDFGNSVYYPEADTLSPFAVVTLQTNSSYLDLDVEAPVKNTGHPSYEAVAVYEGGVYRGLTSSGAGRGVVRFNLSGSGTRTVQLVTTGQERPADQGQAKGSILYSVQGAAGTATSKVAPVRKSKRVYIFGDSLNNGIGSDNPQQDAVARQMMAANSAYEIVVEGSGYHSMGRSYNTASLRLAAVQRVEAYMAGATEVHVWLALGMNDYLNGWSIPAETSGYIGALIDLIHSRNPTYIIHVQSLTPTSANGPYSKADYRTAVLGLNNNQRNTWVRVVDGLTLTTETPPDTVHFTRTGYTQIAQNMLALLPAAPTGPVFEEIEEGSLPVTLNGTSEQYWEVQDSAFTNFLGVEPELTIWVSIAPQNYTTNTFFLSKQISQDNAIDRTLGLYSFGGNLYFEYFTNNTRHDLSLPWSSVSYTNGQPLVVGIRYTPTSLTLFAGNGRATSGNPGGDLPVSSTPIRFGSVLDTTGTPVAKMLGIMRNGGIVTRALSDTEITALISANGVLTDSQLAESTTLGNWPMLRTSTAVRVSSNRKPGRSGLSLVPVTAPSTVVRANEARFVTSGAWGKDSTYGGQAYTNDASAYGTLSFAGSSFKLRGNRFGGDNIKITFDGGTPITVSTAGAEANDVELYATSSLSASNHTVRIEKASTTTGYISVTAFEYN